MSAKYAPAAPGLSPQARGERWCAALCGSSPGPIPAGAGGTIADWLEKMSIGAYPRRRGGNFLNAHSPGTPRGLSPQARGERLFARCRRTRSGPIPAGAGGTVPRKAQGGPLAAYPRRRGGNFGPSDIMEVVEGLSPQARGEPRWGRWRRRSAGPIPAGAGGTFSTRGLTASQGPIPAGAGGTPWRQTPPCAPRAYPRRRGGNGTDGTPILAGKGLSPQARGEQGPAHGRGDGLGPIPAGAGGTPMRNALARAERAYPRRRGGNSMLDDLRGDRMGLSPQARGELLRGHRAGHDLGPIPAGAGGTSGRVIHPIVTGAYPRRRGGNSPAFSLFLLSLGLSPQARGEPHGVRPRMRCAGPIPAGAGGTAQQCLLRRGGRAYPRRRGGNMGHRSRRALDKGLSPQARGERYRNHDRLRSMGPIPAGAGGTRGMNVCGTEYRAYPRRRGGNGADDAPEKLRQGLSPQARGEQCTLPSRLRTSGPIPAGAGGTNHTT